MLPVHLPVLDTLTRAEQGVPVTIRRPDTGEPVTTRGTALVLVVKGSDSAAYQQAIVEVAEERAASAAKGEPMSIREFTSRVLAQVTIGWEGVFGPDGQPVAFSQSTALEMYRAFPVLTDQVDAFVGTRQNFMMASSND